MRKLKVSVVGGPHIEGRYFEAVIVEAGELNGRAIDLPFKNGRKMDYQDPSNPFVMPTETRWRLNANDGVIALVDDEKLSAETIVSFAWGPAFAHIGEEMTPRHNVVKKPMAKRPVVSAGEVFPKDASAIPLVGKICLPEPGFRKSPLGHFSIVDAKNPSRQIWSGPLDREKIPAMYMSEAYRYFTWTLNKYGKNDKVEIRDPLTVEIETIYQPDLSAPVVKANKAEASHEHDSGDLLPKRNNKRKKSLRPQKGHEIDDDVVIIKNSGPKPAPAPIRPSVVVSAQKPVVRFQLQSVARLFDPKDQSQYRVFDPNGNQIDRGNIKQLVARAVAQADQGGSPLVHPQVILEWEETPGGRRWIRCTENIIKVGVAAHLKNLVTA